MIYTKKSYMFRSSFVSLVYFSYISFAYHLISFYIQYKDALISNSDTLLPHEVLNGVNTLHSLFKCKVYINS